MSLQRACGEVHYQVFLHEDYTRSCVASHCVSSHEFAPLSPITVCCYSECVCYLFVPDVYTVYCISVLFWHKNGRNTVLVVSKHFSLVSLEKAIAIIAFVAELQNSGVGTLIFFVFCAICSLVSSVIV